MANTTYDIFLDQLVGFGQSCWTKLAWFAPRWLQGDGWKGILPVIFSAF